ncbi:TRAP transporter substrate-binding protein DctP [Microbacterium sp. zg.B48]|uniref:TRAP transporter substrate-binding protein DctP n=1 Tax=unclassified Microbacterium TaxID=2609290 RepID=UPI00214BAAF2|nr:MULTISPECIES: TRAP transporter substrate-binding protein DctP [unclassified Microbacterium]MCR2764035.1 TRAP transporter substrate-binding protein DctP [Microbacterium sp. zg.B48]MCR2810456.1 TRAP transporter substrate-binding protein DctP [Microbacterium sp. zg.B185]WIM18508.1 TRAP transporter substrate-binding protein DctP [Microbacterium sp. zg-B185]
MFSPNQRRLLTGVAVAVTAAAVLAGCSSGTPSGGSGEETGGGYSEGQWEVTITSVAADQSVLRPGQEWYMDQVEERTDGAITFNRTTANEICAQADQYACLEDGSAQLLVTVPNYQPSIFVTNSLPEITFGPTNSAAITAAMAELTATNEDVKAFLDAKNLYSVSTWSVGNLLVGSNVPLEGPDDLKGLTMRTAGTIAAPNLAAAGVIPTQVTADEAYNSFSTGLVSAAAGAMDFVVAWKLGEVLKYWVDPGLGVYSEFAMYWAKDYYDEFPDDIKATLEEVADELNSGAEIEVWKNGYDSADGTHFVGTDEQCEMISSIPNVQSLTAWDEDAVADFKELGALVDGQTYTNDELWVRNATAAGLSNAEGVLDDYKALIKKYEAEYDDPALSVDPVTSCIESFNG